METKFKEFLNENWLFKNGQDKIVDKLIEIIDKNKNSLNIEYSERNENIHDSEAVKANSESYELSVVKTQQIPNDPFGEDAEELGRINILSKKIRIYYYHNAGYGITRFETHINNEEMDWPKSLSKKVFNFIEKIESQKKNSKIKQDLDNF